jgi:hypothetical protein
MPPEKAKPPETVNEVEEQLRQQIESEVYHRHPVSQMDRAKANLLGAIKWLLAIWSVFLWIKWGF